MFKDDWIMRQVQDMVRFVTTMMGKKGMSAVELAELEKTSSGFKSRLTELTEAGKIKEAERLLTESLDPSKEGVLRLAVDFYDKLNRLSDAELAAGGFSRDEIKKGLANAAGVYGIPVSMVFMDLKF